MFILILLSGCFKPAPGPNSVNAEFYYNRGLEYLKTNELDKAERELRYAVELNDQLAPAHLALALLYYRNKQYATAEHHIDETLKLSDTWPEAYLLKGKILFQKEDYSTALDFINIAANVIVDNNNNNHRDSLKPEFFLWRGLCLKNLNKNELAAIELAAALKLDPDNQPAIQAMNEIRIFNEMSAGLSPAIRDIIHKNSISRADWATLLVKGLSKNFVSTFAKIYDGDNILPLDIGKNDDVIRAVRYKLVNVYPDGEFKPDLYLSWAEVIISLKNILNSEPTNHKNYNSLQTLFTDLPRMHPLYDAAAMAQSLGIFKSLSQKSFLLSESVKGSDALYVIRNLNQVIE